MSITYPEAEAYYDEQFERYKATKIDIPEGSVEAQAEFGYIIDYVQNARVNWADLDVEGRNRVIEALKAYIGDKDIFEKALSDLVGRDCAIKVYSPTSPFR